MTTNTFPATRTDEQTPLLTFLVGEQHYALLIEDVVEVAAMMELVQVRSNRPEVLGIANRHGTPLPVIDLRQMLLGQAAKVDVSTLFIVVSYQAELFGLVVDKIEQVEHISLSNMRKSTASGNYIRGIISNRQRLIQVLALAPLLSVYSSDMTVG